MSGILWGVLPTAGAILLFALGLVIRAAFSLAVKAAVKRLWRRFRKEREE